MDTITLIKSKNNSTINIHKNTHIQRNTHTHTQTGTHAPTHSHKKLPLSSYLALLGSCKDSLHRGDRVIQLLQLHSVPQRSIRI